MRTDADPESPPRLLKVCGADVELGNFFLGGRGSGSSGAEAARALLREIAGVPARGGWSRPVQPEDWRSSVYGGRSSCEGLRSHESNSLAGDAQDWGRKFLPDNGGCVYIDLDHLEVCIPEVTSAWDFVAAWHAMLRLARHAQHAVNQNAPAGRQVQVLANNSDGQGNSYGSHLNFLITRRAWDNIFNRRMHHLLYLAAFQVSSLVFTGQGKVGSENQRPHAPYQLSQRADFFEVLTGPQTTYQRPIVNSRDETLCGSRRGLGEDDPARLHAIFFDSTLAHVATLLKAGVMQIVLAMIEAERVNPSLLLEDPVEAVTQVSHDPTLQARPRMASGQRLTAIEIQMRFLEEARSMEASGAFHGTVPRAGEILALWEETLTRLERRDFDWLAPRLDWVMKLSLIERALDLRRGLDWDSPEIKHLDQAYSSLGDDGLYFAQERSGSACHMVGEDAVARFEEHPPPDTRAWTRAMLLRGLHPSCFDAVDWDSITLRLPGNGYWPLYRTLSMPDPLGMTQAECQEAFRQWSTASDLVNAIQGFGDTRSFGAGMVPGIAGVRPGYLLN